MLQVEPDWSMIGTADKLEKELRGLKFTGPGMYCWPDRTLLILPQPLGTVTDKMIAERLMWKREQPEGTLYIAFVWSCPRRRTILGQAPPTRFDGEHVVPS